MNLQERAEYLRHCKYVDEVELDTPYTPNVGLLQKFNCDFYAHGDDIAVDADGTDITAELQKLGMFKMFKRTEGVSTTSLTAKLLKLGQKQIDEELKAEDEPMTPGIDQVKYQNPPQQQFLANTIRLG